MGGHFLLQRIFPTRIEPESPVSPALLADSLPAEPKAILKYPQVETFVDTIHVLLPSELDSLES